MLSGASAATQTGVFIFGYEMGKNDEKWAMNAIKK
jgi:hypothetical protein